MPFDIDCVRNRLPGRQIYYYESIGSTMQEAARLAAQGCTSGTSVIANEQTAGQGRHGHHWYSERDSGLYVSIVLRPGLPAESFPALTLALGLATAETISRAMDLRCDLRWPNDVLLRDKKVAGILVQLLENGAVAGIGINVNHGHFPSELESEATSLRIESGRAYSREDLLTCLLPAVDSFSKMLAEAGKQAVLDMFSRHCSYAQGRRVRVRQSGGEIEGTTAGLDASGFLILKKDDGGQSLIVTGGVRPA